MNGLVAVSLMQTITEIIFSCRVSYEYLFLLQKNSKIFNRCEDSLQSFFDDYWKCSYKLHWKNVFPTETSQSTPEIVVNIQTYPTDDDLHQFNFEVDKDKDKKIIDASLNNFALIRKQVKFGEFDVELRDLIVPSSMDLIRNGFWPIDSNEEYKLSSDISQNILVKNQLDESSTEVFNESLLKTLESMDFEDIILLSQLSPRFDTFISQHLRDGRKVSLEYFSTFESMNSFLTDFGCDVTDVRISYKEYFRDAGFEAESYESIVANYFVNKKFTSFDVDIQANSAEREGIWTEKLGELLLICLII